MGTGVLEALPADAISSAKIDFSVLAEEPEGSDAFEAPKEAASFDSSPPSPAPSVLSAPVADVVDDTPSAADAVPADDSLPEAVASTEVAEDASAPPDVASAACAHADPSARASATPIARLASPRRTARTRVPVLPIAPHILLRMDLPHPLFPH